MIGLFHVFSINYVLLEGKDSILPIFASWHISAVFVKGVNKYITYSLSHAHTRTQIY